MMRITPALSIFNQHPLQYIRYILHTVSHGFKQLVNLFPNDEMNGILSLLRYLLQRLPKDLICLVFKIIDTHDMALDSIQVSTVPHHRENGVDFLCALIDQCP